jgi:DNA recombination-dependent growth factor C
MPLLKGAATFTRYRVEPDAKSQEVGGKPAKAASKSGKHAPYKPKTDLAKLLKLRVFVALEPGGEEERAQGFCEQGKKDGLEFTPGALYEGEFALFSYRVDEVRIPSAQVKAELEAWEQQFEGAEQRKPSRKEKLDRKGEIRHTLKSKYPITTKLYDVSWNLETGFLQVWAGSRKAIDEVSVAVEQMLSAKLVAVAPVTVAMDLGIPDGSLMPTPELSNPEEFEAANG